MSEVAKYDAGGHDVVLSKDIIKNYLVSGDAAKVTDQEVTMFLELCKGQRLNPFLREAYLVKFGSNPAQLIVGKDVFVKRAKLNPTFRGFRAGIIIEKPDGSIERRNGTFYSREEKLVGGFCEVAIEGWAFPLEHTVSMAEFSKGTATWKSMPAVMIRKVALVQALREAFPEDFQAMYSEEEMPVDQSRLPREPVNVDDRYSDTIQADQARRLFEVADDPELVRSVIESYGYNQTADIDLGVYDCILADIENAKKIITGEEVEEAEFEEVEEDPSL